MEKEQGMLTYEDLSKQEINQRSRRNQQLAQ
jgi:hypothetical protein